MHACRSSLPRHDCLMGGGRWETASLRPMERLLTAASPYFVFPPMFMTVEPIRVGLPSQRNRRCFCRSGLECNIKLYDWAGSWPPRKKVKIPNAAKAMDRGLIEGSSVHTHRFQPTIHFHRTQLPRSVIDGTELRETCHSLVEEESLFPSGVEARRHYRRD
jgi:hypothetical protein